MEHRRAGVKERGVKNGNKPAIRTLNLRAQVTCPHCWHNFRPEQSLWIAQHPDLLGDPRLGQDLPQRFLPTRFTVEGAALDSRGFPCRDLACPRCHLGVPRALLELEQLFISILGAPACGKSYFLAAMTYSLRQSLPRQFGLSFTDADPGLNQRLHEYEEVQFMNPNPDELVALAKTEMQGDLYETVLFDGQAITYPRPFLFCLRPLGSHPSAKNEYTAKAICVYDNAGESFLPNQDKATQPVTQHLASSRALLYLFDPTQDSRFRKACQGHTNDPQMQPRSQRLTREAATRQEIILQEATGRIRRHLGLAQSAKHRRPLFVIVTKADCWSFLLDTKLPPEPLVRSSKGEIHALRRALVDQVSQRLREVLWKYTPELVATAEGFADEVIYIPVSAMGRSPETDPQTGALGIRPKDIKPWWVEVPLLYFLSRWVPALVPYVNTSGSPTASDHGSVVPVAHDEPHM